MDKSQFVTSNIFLKQEKSAEPKLQHGIEEPKLEVVESDEQTKRNEKCAGESVSSSSEGLRRSARKTFVASGSYTMKGKQLFQTKDKKVLVENQFGKIPSFIQKESLLLLSKDGKNSSELDETLKLPQQHLTPTVKPKNDGVMKNGSKENCPPVSTGGDPMIYEGSFPILKLHRCDERLPPSGDEICTSVLPSGSHSPAAYEELEDKWLHWNGDGYSNYSSNSDDDEVDDEQKESSQQEIIDSLEIN